MSALRLLFGFRKEVPSHVIVDIRLFVLLLLKGFAVAAVLLLFSLSCGEAKNEAGHSTETHDPTKRDSPRRQKKKKKKKKEQSRTGTNWGNEWRIVRRVIIGDSYIDDVTKFAHRS